MNRRIFFSNVVDILGWNIDIRVEAMRIIARKLCSNGSRRSLLVALEELRMMQILKKKEKKRRIE